MKKLFLFVLILGSMNVALQAASFDGKAKTRFVDSKRQSKIAQLTAIAASSKPAAAASASAQPHVKRLPSAADTALAAMDPAHNLTDTTQGSTVPLGVVKQQFKAMSSAFDTAAAGHQKSETTVTTQPTAEAAGPSARIGSAYQNILLFEQSVRRDLATLSSNSTAFDQLETGASSKAKDFPYSANRELLAQDACAFLNLWIGIGATIHSIHATCEPLAKQYRKLADKTQSASNKDCYNACTTIAGYCDNLHQMAAAAITAESRLRAFPK